jgi:hypothetical protein
MTLGGAPVAVLQRWSPELHSRGRPTDQSMSTLAKTCQANTLLAIRLKAM